MSQRLQKGQGEDLGGTQIRSRFDKREMQQRVMDAGKDPNFRDRPEIARMRRRAEVYKSEMAAEQHRKRYENT